MSGPEEETTSGTDPKVGAGGPDQPSLAPRGTVGDRASEALTSEVPMVGAEEERVRNALWAAWNDARDRDDMLGMEEHDGVEFTLHWLRALPVEQRMEAMGMRAITEEEVDMGDIPTDKDLWREADA